MKWPILLLLLVSGAFAAEIIKVGAKGDTRVIAPNEMATFDVTVTNAMDADAEVRLSVASGESGWVTIIHPKLFVPKNGTNGTKVYVTAPGNAVAGAYGFGVLGAVKGKETVFDIANFDVTVVPTERLLMAVGYSATELEAGGDIEVTTKVENFGNVFHEGLILDTYLYKGNKLIWHPDTTVFDLSAKEEKGVVNKYFFKPNDPAGEYSLRTYLKTQEREISQKEQPITMAEKRDLVQTKDADIDTLWTKKFAYTFENNGNVPEERTISRDFTALETRFLTYSIEPSGVEGNTHFWTVRVLPGETENLVVSTYGKVLAVVYALFAIVFILLAYTAYFKIKSRSLVQVTKDIIGVGYRRNEVELKVAVHVKNVSKKTLRDIQVSDAIPKDFEAKHFLTNRPKQITELKDKIEYIWNFDEFVPFEERALIYHVVGPITRAMLPSAIAHVKVEDGRATYFAKSERIRVPAPEEGEKPKEEKPKPKEKEESRPEKKGAEAKHKKEKVNK